MKCPENCVTNLHQHHELFTNVGQLIMIYGHIKDSQNPRKSEEYPGHGLDHGRR